ncbi:MAG: helix-turn-helix domain-containing protein [Coriobacteriia bacterium]|nr:helix-turn-helix domain-containing protein [Coriobacteriia bacterium]
MQRVGEILLEERNHRGISLVEISEHTHIRQAFLTAIEEGDYDALPSLGHTKGFVISYAQFLGLDGNVLAAQIAEEMATEPQKGRGPLERAQHTNRASTDRNEIPWKVIWPLLAAIIITGALVWALSTFVFTDSTNTPKPQQKTTTTEAVDGSEESTDTVEGAEESIPSQADDTNDAVSGDAEN